MNFVLRCSESVVQAILITSWNQPTHTSSNYFQIVTITIPTTVLKHKLQFVYLLKDR